ncbi:MAG: glycosyl hydrolase [Planctomycetota bacterium]
MKIKTDLSTEQLHPATDAIFDLAAEKTRWLDESWDPSRGPAVFTAAGKYTTRGWTEWTRGFQYGCLILAGDGLKDQSLIDLGRTRTVERMLPHVTHIGVHDHGFNNLSTYGNLLRLLDEGRLEDDPWERCAYQNAIAVSGAVQASRWADTRCGLGYIYSFNGPHSLFIDTIRTLRILGVAHQLGHVLMMENDVEINLLNRSIQHALATSKYIIFHGETSHTYDVRGRTAHEGTFNRNDGNFRARGTQQGYSPFSTWTRGLAWAMLGYAEQLEFFQSLEATEFEGCDYDKKDVIDEYRRCAIETCDHYIEEASAADGITYWDDGAPRLYQLGDWRSRPADPCNAYEPVDASASAIAAQGLLRLGRYLGTSGEGKRYWQAGLSVAETLFAEPYLAVDRNHQGLLLHNVYHWPNRWDYIPPGQQVAQGESSLWGDYHLLELALLIKRVAENGPYPVFFVKR